jgi:hypothetical protein
MQTSAAPSSKKGRSGLPASHVFSHASRDRFFDDAWLQHSKLLGMRCFAFLVRVFCADYPRSIVRFSRGLALPRGQINI